ncbi:MAG: hypothetical protein Q9166_004501 [cf. Caloplaca sp. 2 TL-2023]
MLSNVRKVAVVGAGKQSSELLHSNAPHLLAERHFEVIDVFEQQANTGGVWNHSSYAPIEELNIPQTDPHQLLEEPKWLRHEGTHPPQPKPVFITPMYDKLESNIPNFLMKYSDDRSLEDQPLFAGHESVLEYLNRYAEEVRNVIQFQTQVYDIRRDDEGDDKWLVCTKDLMSDKVSERLYDAVAVASGHYYVPIVPDIPGIRDWSNAYPNTISHSKYYRTPDGFKGKKVVVVGNSTSGLDIATQISTVSQHPLLNSKRSEAPNFQRSVSWKKEMPEIAEFLPPCDAPQAIRCIDGQIETNVDAVVFCTGYYYSFPFLSSLQPTLIVTGERVENTYKHLFYTDHPSIAFVGLPYKIIPFRTCEGQAAVVARVWSGRLELPSEPDMRKWEADRIADRGAGKKFHELGNLEDLLYHNDLVDWALQAKPKTGDETPPKWNEKDAWARKNIPAMKKAFAGKGEARHTVKSIEDLGFVFDDQAVQEA